MRSRDVALAAALGAAALAARASAFPWSTDMFRGASVQPFDAAPRPMPAGTMPVDGGEPPLARDDPAADALRSPLPATPDHVAHGKALFEINCATCHGATGEGNGPTAYQPIIPPANLTAGQPTERTDGYIYETIRGGGIVMPAYGDAMSANERWEVVLFVRSLQHGARR